MKPEVSLLYARPSYHSGQAFATHMLIEGFKNKEMFFKVFELPALKGNENVFNFIFSNILKLFKSFFQVMFLVVGKNFILHVNLGQTSFSFFREGLILVFFSWLRGSNRIVIGLHGSNFMQWEKNSLHARCFKFILLHASKVCVLGLSQKLRLSEIGIHSSDIVVLPNTCSLIPVDLKDKIKFQSEFRIDETFKVLFLSNLIPSKGFPEFLEALQILADQSKFNIQGVLCGKIVEGKLEGRFSSIEELEGWIEAHITKINSSDRVKVSWQKGADGKIKENLFYDSHLFVFPSSYFNEAQPIVLIEAIASGCAIITTDVGEITSTIIENEAIILNSSCPKVLADSIEKLISSKSNRLAQVKDGHKLFTERYSMHKHLHNWETLFSQLLATNERNY